MFRGNRAFNAVVFVVASSVFTACTSDLRLKNQPSLTVVSGDQQVALASTALPQPLKVLVKDYAGRILSHAIVHWTIEKGDGVLSAPTSTSDANGYASVNYTFGSSITQNLIHASVDRSDTIARFELTNTLPTTPWARQIGTTAMSGVAPSGNDVCRSVAVDSSGNSVCAGFTGSSIGGPNAGGVDFLMRKYDPDGNTLWTVQYGGTGSDQFSGVAFDSHQNIYVVGSTSSNLADTLSGSTDAIIAKYDSDGNLLWFKQFGATSGYDSTGADSFYAVAIDGNDNAYCAGSTSGSFAETNGGSNDILAMEMDSNGTVLWARQLGSISTPVSGNSVGSEASVGLIRDSAGNLYIPVQTSGSFGEVNGGSTDLAVVKLSHTGSVVWVKQFGSVSTPISASGNEYLYGIAVDAQDQIYVTGGTTSSFAETNGGASDILILKLASTDGHLIWAKQWGSTTVPVGGSTSGSDTGDGVTVLGDFLYFVGETTGSFAEANGGSSDSVFMKLDLDGGVVWTKQNGATTHPVGSSVSGSEFSWGMTVDRSGNILANVRTTSSYADTAGGAGDFMLMKVSPTGGIGL